MLIWIVPRGKVLMSCIRCDPEVFAGKTSALHDVGIWMSKGKRVLAGKECVSHRLVEPVLDCWIDDPPVAGREWIDHLRTLPGVQAVGAGTALAPNASRIRLTLVRPGDSIGYQAALIGATPDYFRALGVRLGSRLAELLRYS